MTSPVLLLALAAAGPLGVLQVAGDAGAPPAGAARLVEQQLVEQGATVVPEATLVERLRTRAAAPAQLSEADAQARLAAAESAVAGQGPQRSVELLDGLIAALALDPAWSEGKARLLEEARVRAASRSMALAGPAETGRAESDEGKRALAHLVDAVRANSTLALDASRYPPKLRRLLEKARLDLQEAGLGGLTLTSDPPGATVYVEARAVGLTPLTLVEALPRGRHRVWVEKDGARSATRFLDVGAEGAELHVDLLLEAGLTWGQRSFAVDATHPFDRARAASLAEVAGADELLLVGSSTKGDKVFLWAVRTGRDGAELDRAALALATSAPSSAEVARLVTALLDGVTASADEVIPPFVGGGEPEAAEIAASGAASPTTAEAAEDEGGLPWVWIGAGAAAAAGVGVLAVVAGGGAATGLLLYSTGALGPSTGTFSVEVQP